MSLSGPKRKSVTSLNHLVGDGKQLIWNCDAERLRRLEVKHQFKLGGLHDRQVGRLGAA